MTDTMETPHHLMTNQRRGCGKLGFTGCKVPGFRGCSCTWAVGGKRDCKDIEEGSGWGEKECKRANTPKEQNQLHLVSLSGTETQERIPVLGLGGPTG